MDASVKSLMLLVAMSIASTQSFWDGIFSPPEITEWKQNLAEAERSGKTIIS